MSKISFTKMHGAGNDYIYVNAMECPIANPEKATVVWSDRHKGIGGDGLIMIDRSEVADFKMRMFNNDGSEGIMCGNGIRCVGKYVYDHRLTTSTTVTIETLGGIKTLQLQTGADNLVTKVRVDMGAPLFRNPDQFALNNGAMQEGVITAPCDGGECRNYTGTFVCMGNPHFVCFVDDIDTLDVARYGSAMETASAFPERCNIEFAEIKADGAIRTRVWERGSGITMACGTGACATAVAAAIAGKSSRRSAIIMDGGTLHIEWNEADGHVYMTGPAAFVFDGEIEI